MLITPCMCENFPIHLNSENKTNTPGINCIVVKRVGCVPWIRRKPRLTICIGCNVFCSPSQKKANRGSLTIYAHAYVTVYTCAPSVPSYNCPYDIGFVCVRSGGRAAVSVGATHQQVKYERAHSQPGTVWPYVCVCVLQILARKMQAPLSECVSDPIRFGDLSAFFHVPLVTLTYVQTRRQPGLGTARHTARPDTARHGSRQSTLAKGELLVPFFRTQPCVCVCASVRCVLG